MNRCIRHCHCRSAPTARAAHAQLSDTLLVGTTMAAALASVSWLMVKLSV